MRGLSNSFISTKNPKTRYDFDNFGMAFLLMENQHRRAFTNRSGRGKEIIWRNLSGNTRYADSESHKSLYLIMESNLPNISSQSSAKDLAYTSPSPSSTIPKKIDKGRSQMSEGKGEIIRAEWTNFHKYYRHTGHHQSPAMEKLPSV
ncbi:hypothetical protein Tco_1316488 [Tanacetum coccineum]